MAEVLMREARSEQANERMKHPRSIDGGYHSSTAAVTLGWVVVRPALTHRYQLWVVRLPTNSHVAIRCEIENL